MKLTETNDLNCVILIKGILSRRHESIIMITALVFMLEIYIFDGGVEFELIKTRRFCTTVLVIYLIHQITCSLYNGSTLKIEFYKSLILVLSKHAKMEHVLKLDAQILL